MKQIQFNSMQYNVDIKLTRQMTIIEGDSATGKSMIYNIICKHIMLKKSSDIICIDYSDLVRIGENYIADKINKSSNKIIVIDNANNVLKSRSILEAIQKDYNNYYILLGRTLPVYSSMSSLAEPLISNNTISIEYLFEG